jgi:hypothetical protein
MDAIIRVESLPTRLELPRRFAARLLLARRACPDEM